MNERQKTNNKKKTTHKNPAREATEDRDLRHVRSRTDGMDDFQKARQQARQRRRRKLMITRMLIVLSVVLIVATIATAVTVKMVADQKTAKGETVRIFGVKEIVVEGDTRYTDKEIIKASKLYVGQSLLSINKAKAARSVVEALPYLDGNQVVVDNASFDTLRIRVVEVSAIAAVECDGKWMILGENNHALEQVAVDKIPKQLIRVEGASLVNKKVGSTLLDERSLRICKTLMEAADRYGLDGMTTIDIREKTKIFIMLNERMQVVLGNETNLSNQIKALTETLPTLYANNGEDAGGRLDMVFYSDDDKSNDKCIYTPQELLDKLEQAQQQPIAAVQTGNDWAVINEDNVVLQLLPEEQLPEDLVRVVGASCDTVVVGKELLDARCLLICHTIVQGVEDAETLHLSSIDVTDQMKITLRLEEGLQVLLGNSSALESQLAALAVALPTVWEQNGTDACGVLDMTSYSDADPDNDTAVYMAPVAP